MKHICLILFLAAPAMAQLFGGSTPARKVVNTTCTDGQVPTYNADGRLANCATASGTGDVTLTGTQTLTNKTLTLPIATSYTVAGLPAAGTAGRIAVVTDAATAGSCTSGGGSNIALCRDSGAAWVPLGDGGSGGSVSAGPGINVAGDVVSADFATTASRDTAASGIDNFCNDTSGSTTAKVCNPTSNTGPGSVAGNALVAYTQGMLLNYRSTTGCTGSPTTVNVSAQGAKKLFGPDGTTALACVAGQTYALYYNTALDAAAGAFQQQSGAGVAAAAGYPDPFDSAKDVYVDNFVPRSGAVTTDWGELGWSCYNVVGSGSCAQVGWYNNRLAGVLRIATGGTTSDHRTSENNFGAVSAIAWLPNLGVGSPFSSWTAQYSFVIDDGDSVANQAIYLYPLASASGYRPTNSIGIRYDTTSQTCTSGTNSTSEFVLEVIASGSSTCVASGVTVTRDVVYTAEIASTTLGTVTLRMKSAGGAWSSPVNVATNVPTAAGWPSMGVITRTNASKMLNVDKYVFQVNGVPR
jgi:hypothetical protein